MTTVTTVPYSKLVATDAINARASTKDGLDELAASIAAKGLIQPLAVRPADGSDKFEIIDGRRRFNAISKLVKAKTWAKGTPIPVLIRNETDADALETSLMANTVRLPMHPVDQHQVFARLAEQGTSDADIAARFGLTERTVRQHRALGGLAQPIREAWRKGKLDAAAARAFTLHPSHDVQAAAFATLQKEFGRSPVPEYAVRRELSGRRIATNEVNDEIVARYVAAGGKLVEDLFSEASYIEDSALLDTARAEWAEAKVADIKARLTGQGWAWVAREKELPMPGWRSWRTLDDDDDDADYRCFDDIEVEEADAQNAKFTAEERARSGVVLQLYTNGALQLCFGVLKPGEGEAGGDQIDIEDAVAKAKPANTFGGYGDDDCGDAAQDDIEYDGREAVVGGGDDIGGSGISSALLFTLTAAQTEAVDRVVAGNPMLAIRLFVASRLSNYGGPLNIRIEGMRGLRDAGNRFKNPEFAETLENVRSFAQSELIEVLGDIIASTIDLRVHNAKADRTQSLAMVAALPEDSYLTAMRASFDAADYFKRSSKATALAAIDEMREAGAASGLAPEDVLAGMKKAELAAAAAGQAKACGWLPPELRATGYAIEPRAQRLTGKDAAAEQTSEAA